ncbi:hypothetical protein [Actinoplanes sp. NBRC 101535]|uniref:hypothetical protein n=1 Tax=Actinoplanes sp. NBRC 101535 TaxID=3032196 RepID=UPI0024A53B04|nr:hypothetical protein [Actinoplanes sp. NBRC 101535]GLY02313.1 hypothetical protein Acsp01_26920 [Actinoplanes sp. NBRC 101535]
MPGHVSGEALGPALWRGGSAITARRAEVLPRTVEKVAYRIFRRYRPHAVAFAVRSGIV